MQIFNADWVGNQIKNQDGKIEKKGGTYPLLKIVTNKESKENTDIGTVSLPGDLKKVKDINFTFPKNYIRQDNRSSYNDFINHNYDVKDTDIQYFGDKLYFNVGLDDKFGFDPEKDWAEILEYLKK